MKKIATMAFAFALIATAPVYYAFQAQADDGAPGQAEIVPAE